MNIQRYNKRWKEFRIFWNILICLVSFEAESYGDTTRRYHLVGTSSKFYRRSDQICFFTHQPASPTEKQEIRSHLRRKSCKIDECHQSKAHICANILCWLLQTNPIKQMMWQLFRVSGMTTIFSLIICCSHLEEWSVSNRSTRAQKTINHGHVSENVPLFFLLFP